MGKTGSQNLLPASSCRASPAPPLPTRGSEDGISLNTFCVLGEIQIPANRQPGEAPRVCVSLHQSWPGTPAGQTMGELAPGLRLPPLKLGQVSLQHATVPAATTIKTFPQIVNVITRNPALSLRFSLTTRLVDVEPLRKINSN